MTIATILKLPYLWALLGLLLGGVCGASDLSVWLIATSLVVFLLFMKFSGLPKREGEGKLFSGGVLLIVGWILGFIIRGILI